MRSTVLVRNLLLPALAVGVLVVASAAPAFARPGDKAIAKDGTLTIDDFSTADWEQSPHADSKPTGLAPCKAIEKGSTKNKKYKVDSPDFTQTSTGARAENTVYVFPKASQAAAFVKSYKAAQAVPCLQASIKKSLSKALGATAAAATDVAVAPIDLSSTIQPGVIDDAVGYAVKVTLPADQGGQVVWFDVVAFRSGRAFDGFNTQNTGEQLPEIQNLVGASVGRLAAALKS